MAAKTILVASSLIALAFAAPRAFAGNAAPDLANASPQQISTPTDGSESGPPDTRPAKRHHHKNARKHRRHQQQPQQPGGGPQQGTSAPSPG